MGLLAGKVAVVSGASRGVGRCYALALAGAGATVVALARSAEGVAEVAAAAGGDSVGWACDIGQDAAISNAVARVLAAFGRVDVLVNNAVWPIGEFPALEVPVAEWEGAYRINVVAPYLLMRAVLAPMAAGGGGAVVNITSGAAGVTRPGMSAHGYPAYAVTKAALERLTTYMAAEFARQNVAVNAVSPGHVGWFMRDGAEPDPGFWGTPLLHLAGQRPRDGGMTGQVLHTYGFGRSWGRVAEVAPVWGEGVVEMLRRFAPELV